MTMLADVQTIKIDEADKQELEEKFSTVPNFLLMDWTRPGIVVLPTFR